MEEALVVGAQGQEAVDLLLLGVVDECLQQAVAEALATDLGSNLTEDFAKRLDRLNQKIGRQGKKG